MVHLYGGGWIFAAAALPGDTVHRLLIGGRDQEADGGHDRLAALVVEHPPLVGLRVVQQGALVPAVHRDLGQREREAQTEEEEVRITVRIPEKNNGFSESFSDSESAFPNCIQMNEKNPTKVSKAFRGL